METGRICLIPGFLCTERIFKHQKKHLTSTFTLEIMKLPALSTMKQLGEELWKKIGKSDTPLILGGLSFGGLLIMEMVRQKPDRVSGLILMDTNALDESNEVSAARYDLVRTAEKIGPGKMSIEKLIPILVNPSLQKNTKVRRIIYTMAEETGIRTMKQHADALASRIDYSDVLRGFNRPALIIHGENDIPCPEKKQIHLETLLKNGLRVSIPQCGHLSSLEKPRKITTVINRWLYNTHFQ